MGGPRSNQFVIGEEISKLKTHYTVKVSCRSMEIFNKSLFRRFLRRVSLSQPVGQFAQNHLRSPRARTGGGYLLTQIRKFTHMGRIDRLVAQPGPDRLCHRIGRTVIGQEFRIQFLARQEIHKADIFPEVLKKRATFRSNFPIR